MVNPEVFQGILYHLISNQEHYKEKFKPFFERRTELLKSEDPVFVEDVNKEYYALIRSQMGDDITKALAIPMEDVLIVLNDLNVDEYFGKKA